MNIKELRAPTVEEITSTYRPLPQVHTDAMDPNKEVIAMATAVFSSVGNHTYDSHKYLTARIAKEYGNNLWIIPTRTRTPYPESIMYSLATLFSVEIATKRRFDWLLWIDDDIVVPEHALQMLRESADPVQRPFVAGIGYMRDDPYWPAVWVHENGESKQWTSHRFGLHKVDSVGLPIALIHRSVFDRAEQPWFAQGDRTINKDGSIVQNIYRTDNWFCGQLRKAGIPIYVQGDLDVTHMGTPMPVNRKTSVILSESKMFDYLRLEQTCRGRREI